MFRFIFFVFLVAIIVYFGFGWIIKYFKSTQKAVEREEHEIWNQYDKKINPIKITESPAAKKNVTKKKGDK